MVGIIHRRTYLLNLIVRYTEIPKSNVSLLIYEEKITVSYLTNIFVHSYN